MGHVSILLDKMGLDEMRLDEMGINHWVHTIQRKAKEQREHAAQKGENKLKPHGTPFSKKFGGHGEVSAVFPSLGGPAEEATHNAVMKMDSLVPRHEEEEEENLKGMGFNRLRMHDILPYARDANYRS